MDAPRGTTQEIEALASDRAAWGAMVKKTFPSSVQKTQNNEAKEKTEPEKDGRWLGSGAGAIWIRNTEAAAATGAGKWMGSGIDRVWISNGGDIIAASPIPITTTTNIANPSTPDARKKKKKKPKPKQEPWSDGRRRRWAHEYYQQRFATNERMNEIFKETMVEVNAEMTSDSAMANDTDGNGSNDTSGVTPTAGSTDTTITTTPITTNSPPPYTPYTPINNAITAAFAAGLAELGMTTNNDNINDNDSTTSSTTICSSNDPPDQSEEEKEESGAENCSNSSSPARYSIVHAPAILGNRIYISKKQVGGSSFDSSSGSDLWDDPAVLPANLTLGISVSQSEAWESSGTIEPDTPQTPTHLLLSQRSKGLFESFSRSPDLTLSPIKKEQELAWAPE